MVPTYCALKLVRFPWLTLYLYSIEPVRRHFPAKQMCTNDTVCNSAMHHCTQYHLYTAVSRGNAFWLVQRNRDTSRQMAAWRKSSIAHSIICTWLFRGKMRSDWFNGIGILQGRWQHGEKVGYCYPSGFENTLCKWDMYVCPAGHEKVNTLFAMSKRTNLMGYFACKSLSKSAFRTSSKLFHSYQTLNLRLCQRNVINCEVTKCRCNVNWQI